MSSRLSGKKEYRQGEQVHCKNDMGEKRTGSYEEQYLEGLEHLKALKVQLDEWRKNCGTKWWFEWKKNRKKVLAFYLPQLTQYHEQKKQKKRCKKQQQTVCIANNGLRLLHP